MDPKFFAKLLGTFKVEADDHLANLSSGLISIENAAEKDNLNEILEVIYREAHSLKGAARAVSLHEIEGICQNIESVFSALKKKEIQPSPVMFDLLHSAVDLVTSYLSSEPEDKPLVESQIEIVTTKLQELLHEDSQDPDKPNGNSETLITDNDLPKVQITNNRVDIQELEKIKASFFQLNTNTTSNRQKSDKSSPEPIKTTGTKKPIDDLLRISFSRLDRLYHFSEELITSKLRFSQIVDNFQQIQSHLSSWRREIQKIESVHTVVKRKIESTLYSESTEDQNILRALFEFLEWNREYLSSLESRFSTNRKTTLKEQKLLQSNIDGLRETIRELLILPFTHLVDIVPKMARDIAKDLGKEVEILIEGAEIEIEKRILDEFRDPLIHLIRNSIDHGIESPVSRLRKGKPAKGRIRISITQTQAAKVAIQIYDDGAGIDAESLKIAAVKRNILSREETTQMSYQNALELVFRSGITTSRVITDISGRGLGMAIVKEKIEKLSGYVEIASELERGTTFTIHLPVSISASRAITILCAERVFQIPTTNLEKIHRVKISDIITIENKPSIIFDNTALPVISLANILQLPLTQETERETIFLCVISLAGEKIALTFDELIDENEIVIKPFNKQLKRIKNIAGAGLTADGSIIPILDVNDLFRSAKDAYSATADPRQPAQTKSDTRVKQVLVADDSITSRMLMKDILESAGYSVLTAIDGIDALTTLKANEFDLVVSDVEMPRLNGFDLTAAIRKNPKTSDLPVVLVTGLSKREDRERGIEVGANAYIIKSSFDQSNMLDIIDKLII